MQNHKNNYLTIPDFLRREDNQRRPGYPYAPECEAEERVFNMGFCYRCTRYQDEDNACRIQTAAAMRKPGQDGYPQALTFDIDGRPTCTEFISDEPEVYRCPETGDLFS